MGEKPTNTRDLGKWATNGMLALALGGGTPYIVTLQTELRQTHDAVIRLEEQAKGRDDQLRRMEEEQRRMREQYDRLLDQLRDRKVVGHVGIDNATVSGNLITGK